MTTIDIIVVCGATIIVVATVCSAWVKVVSVRCGPKIADFLNLTKKEGEGTGVEPDCHYRESSRGGL